MPSASSQRRSGATPGRWGPEREAVGVREIGGGLGLAQEALGSERGGEIGLEHL